MIRVPEGVTTLGDSALGGTTSTNNIVSVVLPPTLTSLGADSLRNNSNLVTLVVHATTPPTVNSNALNGLNNSHFKIRVPKNSVSAYQSASGWSAHASKIFSI